VAGFTEALERRSGAKTVTFDFRERTATVLWGKGIPFDYDAVKRSVNRSPLLVFRWLLLVVRGEVTDCDGEPALRVTGTNELFLLESDPKDDPRVQTPLAKLLAAATGGKTVVVTGKIEPLRRPKSPQSRQPVGPRLALIVTEFADPVSIGHWGAGWSVRERRLIGFQPAVSGRIVSRYSPGFARSNRPRVTFRNVP
jgi:hypothetical protein